MNFYRKAREGRGRGGKRKGGEGNVLDILRATRYFFKIFIIIKNLQICLYYYYIQREGKNAEFQSNLKTESGRDVVPYGRKYFFLIDTLPKLTHLATLNMF